MRGLTSELESADVLCWLVKRATIAAVFAAALAISGSAEEFMADAGVRAVAFPKPDRPVADIVSPIWHSEKERDAAGEPRQLVRLLGIKSGMTVADIGAGSGYYVVRLSPIVGPHGRIIAEDVVPEYLRGLRKPIRGSAEAKDLLNCATTHKTSSAPTWWWPCRAAGEVEQQK
jgi:predicted methyltransferase